MNIFIFDKKLNRLGLANSYGYLKITNCYNKVGSLDIHLSSTLENFELLKKDNIIYRSGDEEAFYIENRQIVSDENGEEILKVSAKSLSKWLDRRIVWDKTVLKGYVSEIINNLITLNVISPNDLNRVIDIFSVDRVNIGSIIEYQNSYGNLLDEIEKLCKAHELGFKTGLDHRNKKLIFKVYKGSNRTINQSANQRCIFSKNFNNLISSEYTDSINDYKNTCLIAGAGEDINRKKASIISGAGLERYELFVDARDLSDKETVNEVETQIDDIRYGEMLLTRAKNKLGEHKEIETFEAVIDIQRENTKYKRDFFLGDIVTIKDEKLNLKVDTRITQIEEVYSKNGYTLLATLGENIPTILDKIKKG